MKSNSSKNRKSNTPTTTSDKRIEGVTKPTSSKSNDDRAIENFFKNEVKELGDVFKNNLSLTQSLIDKEMNNYRKSNKKIYSDFEKTVKLLNLSKSDGNKLLESKRNSMLKETNNYYNDLLKKYGLLTDENNGEGKNSIAEKIGEKIESFKGKVEKVIDKNNDALKGAIFGSLNLITSPLEDFFGFDTMDLIKKALHLGDKKTKKKPTKSDVQKKGDDGALFISNQLDELFGKNKKDKKDDKLTILQKLGNGVKGLIPLLGNFVKSIPILGTALKGFGLIGKSFGKNMLKGGSMKKFLFSGATKVGLKAISPLAIISSIIMMVVDGIKGLFKAKEWQVPKASAILGGMIGGVESGAKNIFAQMGKWALMGFGVGSLIAPPIGSLVGGIVGAIFGAVVGAVGGKNLAKFFTEFGQIAIAPFKEIGKIWKDEEGTVLNKIMKTLGKVINGIITLPFKFYGLMFDKIKGWFKNKKEQKKQEKEMKKNMKPKNKDNPITSFFKGFWEGAKKSMTEFLKNPLLFSVKGALNWTDKVMEVVWDGVANLISGIFGTDVISWKDFKTTISDTIQKYVIEPMGRMFGVVGDFFDMLVHDPFLVGKAVFTKYTLADAFEEYSNKKKVVEVNDAIIKKDGTIVKTSEDDNLIATKNNPTKITSMDNFNENRLRDVISSNKNTTSIDYSNKFDKMIGLLEKLLDKEVVVNTENSNQSLSDLRVLAGGFDARY